MPTIPLYNQGATEEAGLTRAKRRVIKALKSGIAKLTEKPDTDPTDGKADVVAGNLISQFEDLTALSRQITAYLGDGEERVELDNPDEGVKALRLVIMAAKATARILRTVKGLAPKMRYLDLGVLSDLKAVEDECTQAFFAAIRAMRSLDFAKLERVMDNIGNYQDPELESLVSDWDDDASFLDEDTLTQDTSTSSTVKFNRDKDASSTSSTVKLGRQSRVNSMFGFMLGAAEDLENAGRRIPASATPRLSTLPRRVPRASRDSDLDSAIERGALLAQLEVGDEEELRREGLKLLAEQVERDKAQESADDALLAQLNRQRATDLKPFKRFGVGAYDRLVDLLGDRYKSAIEILYVAYENFNAYRQQKVTRNEADIVDVGNAIKTGAGFEDMVQGSNARLMGGKAKVYKIGGSSDILYRREGLPRFL